jgi:hypothetical protein
MHGLGATELRRLDSQNGSAAGALRRLDSGGNGSGAGAQDLVSALNQQKRGKEVAGPSGPTAPTLAPLQLPPAQPIPKNVLIFGGALAVGLLVIVGYAVYKRGK